MLSAKLTHPVPLYWHKCAQLQLPIRSICIIDYRHSEVCLFPGRMQEPWEGWGVWWVCAVGWAEQLLESQSIELLPSQLQATAQKPTASSAHLLRTSWIVLMHWLQSGQQNWRIKKMQNDVSLLLSPAAPGSASQGLTTYVHYFSLHISAPRLIWLSISALWLQSESLVE